jgi:D-Tyr-tRNA(Tyr) deacylase
VLVGVERGDGPDDVDYIARKIRELRIFDAPGDDASRKRFERSVQDVGGQVLVVSQFTLAADCRKGRRPAVRNRQAALRIGRAGAAPARTDGSHRSVSGDDAGLAGQRRTGDAVARQPQAVKQNAFFKETSCNERD